jgi:glycerate dehydrogenase
VALGECTIYDRTPREEVLVRSIGADIILTNKTVLTEDLLAQLHDLKYIGVLATGFNVVDTAAAAQRRIPVTNIPEYGNASVAQMVFAHVLNLCNHVAQHSDSVRQGNWSKSKDFCFWEYLLIELSGETMGIVGLGRIGCSVARLSSAFGMRVVAYDPYPPSVLPDNIEMIDLETLFRTSDVVSLHCPLTEQNRSFVNIELISVMKPKAFLINTSRGPLVDETALAYALNNGIIAGAGIDVLANEPPDPSCPLLKAKNCFITPHIAWATHAARKRLMDIAIDNVKAFLCGEKLNVVNDW